MAEKRRAETVNPTALRRLKRVSLIECLCAQIANDDSTLSACDVHGLPLNSLDNLQDTSCLSQPETFSIIRKAMPPSFDVRQTGHHCHLQDMVI